MSSSNPTGSGWVNVPGRLMQIDVDGDQAVGVNSGHNIYLSDVTSGLFKSSCPFEQCTKCSVNAVSSHQ